MARAVTVAVIGDPARTPPLKSPDDWDVPYKERVKVSLEADDAETLGSVLGRAMTELNIEVSGWSGEPECVLSFVGFYNEHAKNKIGRVGSGITLVDQNGRAVWGKPFRDATVGELVGATEGKALDGDGTRPYLILQFQAGGPTGVAWSVLLTGWTVALMVMSALSNLEGTLALGDRAARVIERLRRGRKVAEERFIDWSSYGGNAEEVRLLLGQRPWLSDDVSRLLGCSTEEAEAVLWAFGFSRAPSGLWRRPDDEANRADDAVASLLADCVDEIFVSHQLSYNAWESVLSSRLNAYFVTGERLPVPGRDLHRFGDHIQQQRDEAAASAYLEAVREPGSPADSSSGLTETRMPLEYLRMACACGNAECGVVASFELANRAMKIGFTRDTDHFVIDAQFMAEAAFQIKEQISRPEHSHGDG